MLFIRIRLKMERIILLRCIRGVSFVNECFVVSSSDYMAHFCFC